MLRNFLHCAVADDFIHLARLCQTAFPCLRDRARQSAGKPPERRSRWQRGGGRMGTSVAELIADRIGVMPASERRAAQTLIANYPLIGLKTVADFSQQAGVSSPTILRFVGRLGFQNYPEFQTALQDELAAQLQSPLNRAENPSSATAGERSPTVNAIV